MSTDTCIEDIELSALCPQCPAWFTCTGSDPLFAPRCPVCGSPAQQVVREPAAVGAGFEPAGTELWVG